MTRIMYAFFISLFFNSSAFSSRTNTIKQVVAEYVHFIDTNRVFVEQKENLQNLASYTDSYMNNLDSYLVFRLKYNYYGYKIRQSVDSYLSAYDENLFVNTLHSDIVNDLKDLNAQLLAAVNKWKKTDNMYSNYCGHLF